MAMPAFTVKAERTTLAKTPIDYIRGYCEKYPIPPGSFLVFPPSFSRHDVYQTVGARVSLQDVPQQMSPSFLLPL